MTTTQHRLLERTGQLMLVLSPLLFVSGLHLLRFGRDLTIVSFVGLAILFTVAIVGCRLGGIAWQIAGVIAIGIIVVTCLHLPDTILWIGSRNAIVVVTIKDADSGLPVADALVRLFEEDDSRQSVGRTNTQGIVHLDYSFVAAGSSSFVQETGGYRLTRETLTVDANGYAAVREPLCKHTGSGARLYEHLPEVEIRIKQKRDD